jgi:tRNA (adenine37-N6)-methyltransferase
MPRSALRQACDFHLFQRSATQKTSCCHDAGLLLAADPNLASARLAFLMFTSQAIGFVSSPYQSTSEVPKGLGTQHAALGSLRILPEFAAGLADIEGFSHLFVIWEFDRANGFELLGTPPSDDRPHGVFATRSPRRPNPIGLTVVELLRRDGPLLHVRGIDMLDGTPILDIKPYLSSIPMDELRRGWLAAAEARKQSS